MTLLYTGAGAKYVKSNIKPETCLALELMGVKYLACGHTYLDLYGPGAMAREEALHVMPVGTAKDVFDALRLLETWVLEGGVSPFME